TKESQKLTTNAMFLISARNSGRALFQASSNMQNRLFRNDVLARVRTNRVYIEIKGMIPGALLQCLRDTYGRRLILHLEYGKRMHNILEAPLYEQEPEEMN